MKSYFFSLFLVFLVFSPGLFFQNFSFNQQPLPSTVNQKDFVLPLKNFFNFQGSSVIDLYNYATVKQKEQINAKFNEIKDNPAVRLILLLPSINSLCNGNLSKIVFNAANFLIFLKTACAKEIFIKLTDTDETDAFFQEISELILSSFTLPKLTDEEKTKMINDLEKIKSQLIWKFLKTQDWTSFEVTNSRWADFDFFSLKNQKHLNFDQLSSSEKAEITKLSKKISKLNIESSWQTVLNQELFPKETNNSQSNGLFIGLGIGGGVFLLLVVLMSFYFYKKYKNRLKNV